MIRRQTLGAGPGLGIRWGTQLGAEINSRTRDGEGVCAHGAQ